MRFRRGVLVICLLGLAAGARAQAWPQAPGEAYVKLTLGNATASEQYRFDGARAPYADNVEGDAFFDESLYLYAEVGVSERLTLVAVVPYKTLRVLDAAFEYESRGLGSVMLGLRTDLKDDFGLRGDRHALAANLLLTLPTGYTRNFTPSVGPGQVDYQGTLAYGLSLYPAPAYAQAALGYRYRSAFYGFSTTIDCQEGQDVNCIAAAEPKYDDELLFSAEAGLSLGRWALLQLLGFGVWSNKVPDAETSFSARNPLPTRQRYLKTGAGLTLYPIPRLGLSLQVFGTPTGRNTVRSTDAFFGIEYRL